ncbi:MAG: ornithine acetyltransferase [Gammaproteobacteria bacterium (ex Lamellibrachia satsuma)]|nr:MAG: bifunctional glutamate N-acetyltransferase/amino-acid acetyltransferase ArgJ [Gammaproteobacteria bacterium (ex Lamellibrachia satsuma)]RRS30643.1 MAG: ornithine acetyltransferase [Gammaproteobacteria bacterium (ex Lamellibrachia satsuma)]
MRDDVYSVPGIRLGVAAAGIKYPDRNDLLVIELPEGGGCAGVFTRNAFCAAPVHVAKQHMGVETPRYLLINSGNANAGTGDQGLLDAQRSCAALAEVTGCEAAQVLPFSTGVIGENLPVDCIEQVLPKAIESLDEASWEVAAAAIMTTDTRPKVVSRQFDLAGESITVTGIAKGSGMIRPDMATMLAYLATDLAVDVSLLQQCLRDAVQPSFNSISVDGDTSTNDACMLLASGKAGVELVSDADSEAYRKLSQTVTEVCMSLAREIVRDGEGATKLVEVLVESATSEREARSVAYTIAHSPLVKTALFASDPNWGRILAAVGRAGLEDLVIDQVEIWLDDLCIVRDGGRATDYTEAAGQQVMDRAEFTIGVKLGRGQAAARILTCDLSYDYVKINAEYRT